ncbi:MAG: phosphoglycerate dehydrogenase, partial [Chloroflexota bacterium]|nr:phosphoglycerate dehydrogenase [Chloroflexota bacterium]
ILSREATVVAELNLPPEKLVERLNEVRADALIVRSGTKVTRDLMKAVPTLKVVGRAGTGVDNIDLSAATARGIIVVNAPTGNSIAAAEHAIALMAALARNIPQADMAMRRGEWDRHRFIGTALAGKTLGIIAMGRVGSEVAKRAKGLGMQVIAYDPYFPAERADAMDVPLVELEEVWSKSDFITLHAPLTDATHHLINDNTLARMKRGVYLINDARGGLIDDEALVRALDSGQVAGAALDVFSEEPPPRDHPLLGRPDVIVTPHLGASTTEAQLDVAREIAEAVLAALKGEPVSSAVNAPLIAPELLKEMRPFMDLAEKLARLAVQLVPGGLGKVRVIYEGKPALPDTRPLKAAVIKGLLEPISEERINRVNAELVARDRGLRITEVKREESNSPVRDTITIEIGNGELRRFQGALLRGSPHIIRIQDFWIDLELNGYILVCHNQDRPGMIGQVGVLLGREQVNISFMQVGRDQPRGTAVMAIGLDDLPPERLIEEIRAVPDISSAELIRID